MSKTSCSSVVHFWYLFAMIIHESSPVESFTPVKCCLTNRGTGFIKAQCNISASDLIGMNAIQQKGFDCLTTCLKNSHCQTYYYNSANCWLGYKNVSDCFTYLVICISHCSFVYTNYMKYLRFHNFDDFPLVSFLKLVSSFVFFVLSLFASVFVLSFFSSMILILFFLDSFIRPFVESFFV